MSEENPYTATKTYKDPHLQAVSDRWERRLEKYEAERARKRREKAAYEKSFYKHLW